MQAVVDIIPIPFDLTGIGCRRQGAGRRKIWGVKEETHAARWGLLRGYSGKATKWVDFVMTDSTRRESCHSLKIKAKERVVNRHLWGVRRCSVRV